MATLRAELPVALRRPSTTVGLVGVIAVWILVRLALAGQGTLALDSSQMTSLHQHLNDARDWVDAHRNTSPVFLYLFNEIRVVINLLVTGIQALISQPALGLPIPVLGWLGVVTVAGYTSWALGGLRAGLLSVAGLMFVGWQGLWQESMDTLALTIASVLVALLIGIPLGVWAGLSDRVQRWITPVLDFMQTMPTFVYLAPLTLVFLIGPASAAIATLIYAMPPAIRITAHGIRGVPTDTVEAAESMGSTRWQSLRLVLLPMARRTIVLGANQTIMAALAMVTIAALIDAPGLGKVVLKALEIQDIGTALNAGLALVVLAVVLDRVTTAAAAGRDPGRRATMPGEWALRRRILLAAGGVVTLVCVYLSRTYVWAAQFPTPTPADGAGVHISNGANTVIGWIQTNLSIVTSGFKDLTTSWVIDPLQSLLTGGPWWATAAAVLVVAVLLAGLRAIVSAAVCLALILVTGLWQDSMVTLASTLVATVLVVLLGVVFGVWMGRSAAADRVIRPVLDAGQVMPAFVYLVPFVALFGASRFTAIVAAVVYAAPVCIKIIADGIRGVSPTTVEAATAAGSNTAQIITKVQLPMAAKALTLATNQGLIYVLSMVVVGGLVGAGALGFAVVQGFEQPPYFGKGLAAGLAIVLLGILLDRITQRAAQRLSRRGRPAVAG
jgi:glycine betaine/proline transport system permease protein